MSPARAIARAGVTAAAVLAVACGGSPSGGMVPSDDGRVVLLDVQAQVFSPHCALSGCHTGAGAPFGLDLSAGSASANVVNVPSAEMPGLMRVAPHDAADSYVYMKVTADPRIQGDPMPQTGPPLSAADLELLRAWIDQGAM